MRFPQIISIIKEYTNIVITVAHQKIWLVHASVMEEPEMSICRSSQKVLQYKKFQWDGVTPHFTNKPIQFLDEKFNNRDIKVKFTETIHIHFLS